MKVNLFLDNYNNKNENKKHFIHYIHLNHKLKYHSKVSELNVNVLSKVKYELITFIRNCYAIEKCNSCF
jgi:hypothetical protein